jgi:hypothetical protein
MRSWKWLPAMLFVNACSAASPDTQEKEAHVRAEARARAPRPVRISDAEAEKKLSGIKLAEPRLCDDSRWIGIPRCSRISTP